MHLYQHHPPLPVAAACNFSSSSIDCCCPASATRLTSPCFACSRQDHGTFTRDNRSAPAPKHRVQNQRIKIYCFINQIQSFRRRCTISNPMKWCSISHDSAAAVWRGLVCHSLRLRASGRRHRADDVVEHNGLAGNAQGLRNAFVADCVVRS